MGRETVYKVHLRADPTTRDSLPIETDRLDYYDSGVWIPVEEGRDFYPWERIEVIQERERAAIAAGGDESDAGEDETDPGDETEEYVDLEREVDESEGAESEGDGDEAESDDGADASGAWDDDEEGDSDTAEERAAGDGDGDRED